MTAGTLLALHGFRAIATASFDVLLPTSGGGATIEVIGGGTQVKICWNFRTLNSTSSQTIAGKMRIVVQYLDENNEPVSRPLIELDENTNGGSQDHISCWTEDFNMPNYSTTVSAVVEYQISGGSNYPIGNPSSAYTPP